MIDAPEGPEDFQDLYENAPCGYLSFLSDGEIVNANRTLCAWLGVTRADLIGKKKFQDLISVGEQIFFETQVSPLLRMRGSVEEIQFNIRSAAGGKIPVLTSTRRASRDSLENPVNRMSIFRISERKKFEEELKLERTRAELAAKAKTDFLSMLSHEIRTPLNALIGVSNLLDSTALSPEQEPFMEMLKNSSDNLMNLLNSILDLSKIESGKFALESSAFLVRDLFRGSILNFQALAQKKGIRVVSEIDPAIPAAAIGDAVRITQILSNLLGNAIKFTSEGSVVLKIDLVHLYERDMKLKIQVIDSGIGIPADKLSVIFEEFSQAESDTTAKFGGTGLGLAISQKLVGLHGSRIEVQSVVGKGSTFSFEILVPIGNPKIDTHGIERVANQTGALKGLSVLLADDSTDNVELMKHLFKKWGADLETAHNGAEALAKVKEKDFDVILMDVRMPVMNGYAAALAIRALPEPAKREIPIVAFSGSTTFEGHEILNEDVFNALIGKPFKPVELVAKLLPYAKI